MSDLFVGAHVEFRPLKSSALMYTGIIREIKPYDEPLYSVELDGEQGPTGQYRLCYADELTVIQ